MAVVNSLPRGELDRESLEHLAVLSALIGVGLRDPFEVADPVFERVAYICSVVQHQFRLQKPTRDRGGATSTVLFPLSI